MLKFLRAHSDTGIYPRYQLECAFHLPSCIITLVSFPNWVCHFFEILQWSFVNCLSLEWRVSMIYVSKVILFATWGNNSMSHLSQGAPLWNHGNFPCCFETFVKLFLPSLLCMFCLSALEMFLCPTPWIDHVIIKMILSCSNLRKIDSSKTLSLYSLLCWM